MEEDVNYVKDKLGEIEELDREIKDLMVEAQGLENLRERWDKIVDNINSYEKRLGNTLEDTSRLRGF